jgi:hypothetical protein
MFISEAATVGSDDPMEFLKNRKAGAQDTASKAKAKGGDAILSYYHFAAKDKPYANVIKTFKNEGLETTIKLCKNEYKRLMKECDLDMSQKEYQAIVGVIEVYGECYIRLIKER